MIHNIQTKTGRVLVLVLCVALVFTIIGCAGANQQTPELDTSPEEIARQLQQLRTDIETAAQEDYPELASQVEQLRQNLEQRTEEEDLADVWNEVEPELETLERQLREGSDEALTTLDAIIEQLQADLQPDAG